MDIKKVGRPKGSTNKATAETRQAVARFIDSSIPHFVEWLAQAAHGIPKTDKAGNLVRDNDGAVKYHVLPDPIASIKAVTDIAEYHLPRLARSETNLTAFTANIGELTAEDLARMPLSDLKRLALEHMSRGDTIDVTPEGCQIGNNMDEVPSWLDGSSHTK